jgi:dTDP-glucose 4,6-dehydratase
MHLLITGGAGFIGAEAVRAWIDRPGVAKLVNLDALTYAADLGRLEGLHGVHPRYVFEPVDLRDRAAVREVVRRHGITHVVHCAAETHVDRSISGPEVFVETNVLGTLHLLEACREEWELRFQISDFKSQIPNCRFVQVSTDEVYGSLGPDEAAFTETHPLQPNSPYSASKAGADHLVRSYVRTHGLPAVITRCVNNFGPTQHAEKFIPTVLRCLAEDQPVPIYGDGRNVREWLTVSDHVEGLRLVLERGDVGAVYNLGSGVELDNLELAGRLCDLFEAETGRPAGTARRQLSFVTDRPGHDRRYAVDASRLRALGWRPATAFDTALRATVRGFLERCCP